MLNKEKLLHDLIEERRTDEKKAKNARSTKEKDARMGSYITLTSLIDCVEKGIYDVYPSKGVNNLKASTETNESSLMQAIHQEIRRFDAERKVFQKRMEPLEGALFRQMENMTDTKKREIYDSLEESYLKFKLFNILTKEGILGKGARR